MDRLSLRGGHSAYSLAREAPVAGVTAAVSARLKADEARRPGFYAAGSGPLPQVRGSTLPVMELALQITLIVTSVLVVLLVLLHRAKGGGLSTLFGGGVQSSLSGSTVVEKNLDRLTLFVTGIWLVSVIGVALLIKYR